SCIIAKFGKHWKYVIERKSRNSLQIQTKTTRRMRIGRTMVNFSSELDRFDKARYAGLISIFDGNQNDT
ncbi:MAG: hypothetical protein ACR2QW_01695, partial [bacterium]